jgi:hypothetical protein
LVAGYFGHTAAIAVATNANAEKLAPPILTGHIVPVGVVRRKDGSEHGFSFKHYLRDLKLNQQIAVELPRVWLSGSLLAIGDALAGNDYFDHAPILEIVYHLRNGVAHGNRFHFTARGIERLNKYAAHNREAFILSDLKSIFEITAALHGQTLLFDYLGPGDVLDILYSVAHHMRTQSVSRSQ